MFLTSNPVTHRLSDDMTSVTTYRQWDDPSRTHDDLYECCRVLTPNQARRICSRFMSVEQYLRAFPEQEARPGEQLTLESAQAEVLSGRDAVDHSGLVVRR